MSEERFFLRSGKAPWKEVSESEFVEEERAARPVPAAGDLASEGAVFLRSAIRWDEVPTDRFTKVYDLSENGPLRFKDRAFIADFQEWYFNRTTQHQRTGGLPTALEVEVRIRRSR